MGSMLGDWPSFDPMNFSQLRPSDPSSPSVGGISRMTPVTYCPTHDRCLPPPNQDNFHIALNLFNLFCKQYSSIIDLLETKCPVITSEARNILLRNMYKRTEDKLRSKRPASENLTSDQGIKHPRTSTAESSF